MRKHHLKPLSICAIALLTMGAACDKPSGDKDGDGKGTSNVGDDIEVVDGKVRFYLSFAEDGTRKAMGLDSFTGCKVQVNGKDCYPNKDPEGRWVIDVPAAANGEYTAARINAESAKWYTGTPFREVPVPIGQFYRTGGNEIGNYPCYATYRKETGNQLVFNDAFALLDIVVKGNAALTSIQAVAVGGQAVSGRGSFSPSKNAFTFLDSAPRAVLNCAPQGAGAKLSAEGVHFPLMIAPGKFSQGIELTLCDAGHRMFRQTIPAFEIAAGGVKTVSVVYQPADDLVWYEGFDRLVWGGDLMGGQNSYGYAPDAEKTGIDGGTARTGAEYATTKVSYDTPGSGFIQSNTWEEVSGYTVASSHQMSEGYIRSRGLDEYTYLFRCQEYQGMMVVGAGNAARGILRTPPITNMDGFATVKLSFRFCFFPGATDSFLCQVLNGGQLTEVKVDGRTIVSGADKFNYTANASTWVGSQSHLPVPASLAEKKTWHEVEATIEHATDGTCFYFAGNSSNSGNHGFCVDDILVTRLSAADSRKGNLRLLYWNIQNGMWADQPNNYDNFVAWVKKYDPDICVWCESASIYKDRTGTSAPTADRFLPNGWPGLAARYGHQHSAVGGWRDNYPQTVTSKYPVTSILKITNTDVNNKPIAHGAAIQEVNVNGRKLWFVTAHMWPQGYGYGVSSANQEASKAKHEGDYYREYEMNYIVAHTINDSKYATQQDWFLLGDFNSRSRRDNWFYNYAADDTALLTQDVVLNKTDMVDVIAQSHPGQFITSTMGSARIDFVYASPSMYAKVVDAMVLMDKWTSSVKSTWYPSFYDPSDHRPILIDLEIN